MQQLKCFMCLKFWMPSESESDDDADPINLPPVDLGKLDPGTRTLIHTSILDGADDDDDAMFPPWENVSLESLISKLESRSPQDASSSVAEKEDPPLTSLTGLRPKMPASRELTGQTSAHEDTSSPPDSSHISEPQEILPSASRSLVPESVLPESLSDVHVINWPKVLPEQFSLTMTAARRWSRIIRPPRRRTGHVIIDVCASSESSGENHVKKSLVPKSGKLQRHVSGFKCR